MSFDPGKILNRPKQLTYIVAVAAFLVVGLIPSVYFYVQYKNTQERLANPSKVVDEEIANLVGRVGKLIELPTGEKPTLITVSDASKLSDQDFFVKAQTGDKVLLYNKAKKEFLFRPSTGKLVNVGSTNSNVQPTPSPEQTTTPTPTSSVSSTKVFLMNGTNTVGLTKTAEKKLKDKGVDFEVSGRDNAEGKYEETTAIDLTGKNKDAAAKIAKAFGGVVGSLPKGETKPKDTDILVILGTNFAE